MRNQALLVPLLALLLVPAASAHGDTAPMRGEGPLDEGGLAWEREVHWHRLVGTVEATGPVSVVVEGPEGPQVAAGPGSSLRVDHLVACCRDAVWTEHTVRVVPQGPDILVEADMVFLHDNLAVVAHDSEPGAWWQTLLIIAALVTVPLWRARRPSVEGDAAPWRRGGRAVHGAAWGPGLLLALVGMMRFGSRPLAGSLGATAWLPLDAGLFNTHAFVMLVLMALWGAGVAFWAGQGGAAGIGHGMGSPSPSVPSSWGPCWPGRPRPGSPSAWPSRSWRCSRRMR